MTDIVARTPSMRALLPQLPTATPTVLDCALHDMRRDKTGVECYPMRPVIRKEAQRNEKVPRECGPGLWEETSGITTKNQNDRHRGHLKRGTPPLISLLCGYVGTRQSRHPESDQCAVSEPTSTAPVFSRNACPTYAMVAASNCACCSSGARRTKSTRLSAIRAATSAMSIVSWPSTCS
jgi:hypothetical protein